MSTDLWMSIASLLLLARFLFGRLDGRAGVVLKIRRAVRRKG